MCKSSSPYSHKKPYGFTLIELMITVSIIGVLSAALYPSMTGYIDRSRDASRTTHIQTIQTGLSAYHTDNERYPSHTSSGCMDGSVLTTSYMPRGVPLSPGGDDYNEGCGPNGHYGYGLGAGSGYYVLTAITENDFGGNYSGSLSNMTGVIQPEQFIIASDDIERGSGSGYLAAGGALYTAVPVTPTPGAGGSTTPTPTGPPPSGPIGTPATYTVTYNTLGGTPATITESVTQNTKITGFPTAPTRSGYTFAGWWTAATGGTQVTVDTVVTGPITYSARWTANATVTLTFNSVSGTAVSPISGPVGSTFTAPANPTRAGYTFAGWSPSLPTVIPSANATYTAQWTASIATIASCTAAGQTYTAATTYPSCSEPDKIICTGNGIGYTWSMCNVGSTIAGTGGLSYGSLFQYGKGYPGWSSDWNVGWGNWGIIQYNWDQLDITWISGDASYRKLMQGPCQNSYHIPTLKEANNTLTAFASNPSEFNVQLKPPLSGVISNGSTSQPLIPSSWWLSSGPLSYAITGSARTITFSLSGGAHTSAGVGTKDALAIRCIRNDLTTLRFIIENNGTETNIVQLPGTTLVPPPIPTKSGYVFAGWSPVLPLTVPIDDTIYTAQWTPGSAYSQCISAGEVYISSSVYPNCNEFDKVICTGRGGGYIWSMCNIGSTLAGTGSQSYGNYYQWGRNISFSGATTSVAGPLSPSSANITTKFITSNSNPYDWITGQDASLWGINDNFDRDRVYSDSFEQNQAKMHGPCAPGYHVPTYRESLHTINLGFGNDKNKIITTLKSPSSGYWHYSWGNYYNANQIYWWTSSPYVDRSWAIYLSGGVPVIDAYYRGYAFPIRCIKN